jgi:pimeloyl-ACP methyl ester carboxylesterase
VKAVVSAVLLAAVILLLLAGEWIAASVAARHPPNGRFLEMAQGRLHLVDRAASGAQKGTVLFLHGASSNHADLVETLGPMLNGQYRLIAPDRPGMGWSERLGGPEIASPHAQADLVIDMLQRLESGPVVLVAHSLAGGLALDMALKRPDLVKGVVLLGAVTHPWPGGIAWYYHPAANPWAGWLFNRAIAIPAGYATLGQAITGVFAPSAVPAGYLDMARTRLLFRPASFRANAEDVGALLAAVTTNAPRYGDLQMPVVAFHGTDDTVTFASIHSERLARAAPKGRFIPLPGVGHMPHHAAGLQIAAIIRELAAE